MRTTVRIDDGLLAQAKREARRRGETLTSLLEQGLRLAISGSHRRPGARRITVRVSSARGGLQPGVDLDDMKSVLDRMDSIR